MALPVIKNIDIIRGQAANLLVTVPDEADLLAASIQFGVSIGPSQPYIITLPTNVDGQVITGALEAADSETLTGKKYYFSCWVVISGDPTPVARGYLNVTNDSRNN